MKVIAKFIKDFNYILYCLCEVQDLVIILFVLRFYVPVNQMRSFQARSNHLTTLLLGRLSPLSS